MRWWVLFAWMTFAWWPGTVAALDQQHLDRARKGTPKDQRGGISILPGYPLGPLLALAIAALIDRLVPPFGWVLIAALHGVWVIVSTRTILTCRQELRRLDGE